MRLRQRLAKLYERRFDEPGYIPTSGADSFFDFVGAKYERSRLIMTTMLRFVDQTEVHGDERHAGTALDLLIPPAGIPETRGGLPRPQGLRTTTM